VAKSKVEYSLHFRCTEIGIAYTQLVERAEQMKGNGRSLLILHLLHRELGKKADSPLCLSAGVHKRESEQFVHLRRNPRVVLHDEAPSAFALQGRYRENLALVSTKSQDE
jgi:hypothetical protein